MNTDNKEIVYVNEVHNWSNKELPWWGNAENIPQEDLAEAKALAESMSDTDTNYEWRLNHYLMLRVGFSWTVRSFYPWFMKSHEDSMTFLREMCDHAWGEQTSHTRYDNKVLGTYDKGYEQTCGKCGKTEYISTSYNNYSGD